VQALFMVEDVGAIKHHQHVDTHVLCLFALAVLALSHALRARHSPRGDIINLCFDEQCSALMRAMEEVFLVAECPSPSRHRRRSPGWRLASLLADPVCSIEAAA